MLKLPERCGKITVYTADDEMPDCMCCDRCDSDFDCCNNCGAEHGWYGYKRTEYKNEVKNK